MGHMLDAALRWYEAGCSVIRAATDGTKRPLGEWKTFQSVRAQAETLSQWFADDYPGIGVVCGQVSGNLEMLEFEGRARDLISEFLFTLSREDPELSKVLLGGYLEVSPSGGLHFFYRVDGAPVAGNTKLASRSTVDGPTSGTPGITRTEPLIETRGEGGFVVVSPSYGPVHRTGFKWFSLVGEPAAIPTITAAQRDVLHAVARSFNEVPPPVIPDPKPHPSTVMPGERTPGEDFNQQATWEEVLVPYGWTLVRQVGNKTFWRRPGKSFGISAVTGGDVGDYFYCWSTSVELPSEQAMSKFRVYTFLAHRGDFSFAAGELRRLGYGSLGTLPEPDVLPQIPASAPAATPGSPDLGGAPPVPAAPEAGALPPAVDQSPEAAGGGADPFAARVAQLAEYELLKLKARDVAKRMYRAERTAAEVDGGFEPVSLKSLLDEPEEEDRYLIDGVWPDGARVLLAAQYKAGKTTLTGNLVRCLVDGDRFLDTYPVTQPQRVGLIDTEMTRGMIRTWLREQNITEVDNVELFPMRGKVLLLDFLDDDVRADMAQQIRDLDIDILILDCMRPVLDSLGLAEDKEAGRFLVHFDALLKEAEVPNGMVVHHMGHSEERSRGDSRIRDWPDVEWKVVRSSDDPSSTRYFSAFGRDVDVSESELGYNAVNRHLFIVGGSRAQSMYEAIVDEALEILQTEPNGLTRNSLRDAIYQNTDFGKTAVENALTKLADTARVRIVRGPRNSKIYKLPEIFY
jgi:hypothetical protein